MKALIVLGLTERHLFISMKHISEKTAFTTKFGELSITYESLHDNGETSNEKEKELVNL